MENIKIGVIGGSGLYQLDNMKIINEIELDTPFGKPSDKYIIGELSGKKVVFLSRHAKGHTILPSELNSRANIYGFKSLGVTHLFAVSAVGSLREEIEPSHLVFPDQIIDRTKGRPATFYGEGIVAHAAFAEPFCSGMVNHLDKVANELGITSHKNKTYVCMEGPLFSTKAESNFHRQIGGDIIGMTAIPEAKLAREAEMCYGMIALSTDYDCWREDEEAVTVEMVLETMAKNIEAAKKVLAKAIETIETKDCPCHSSMQYAVMTDKSLWPASTKRKLHEILKKYF